MISNKARRRTDRPRIFLGASGDQAELLQEIHEGPEDVADVEPSTTTFNPDRSTLDRLLELSHEVDFAAFVFAQDDWTTAGEPEAGQTSPRDNAVFETGLFGGALGIRRTFIPHADGSTLPTDLHGGDLSTSTKCEFKPAVLSDIALAYERGGETRAPRGLRVPRDVVERDRRRL